MRPEDFTKEQFSLKLPLYLDRKKAFELVASSGGLVSWFIGRADFYDQRGDSIPDGHPLHTDDRYEWTWQKGYEVSGKVLDYTEGEKFEFTFGGPFSVAFTLTDIEPGKITEVTLTQKNSEPSPANEFGFLNCCVCWTFFLTNLKSVGENQVDLREITLMDETFINQ